MRTMNTKDYWMVVLLVATAGLAAACSRSDIMPMGEQSIDSEVLTPVEQRPGATAIATDDDQLLRIGVVTDIGKVDDRSFNQFAWEGAQQGAAAVGGEVSYIESESRADYERNINIYVERDVDVIVTVGFALGEATIAAAKRHPDIIFIGVDQDQSEVLPNVAGLIIPADHSGFLAGALAGMITQSNIIAAVLGTEEIPAVVAFKEGWDSGAHYTNPNVKTIAKYHPGTLNVVFNDPDWGAATAQEFLNQGADVIFAAAGNTGNGALVAVAEQDQKGVYCIGVDADQWQTLPEARSCLVTSALRFIGPGIAELITAVHSDTFSGGNIIGSVGLAPFYDFEAVVTQPMRDALDAVLEGLKDGSISSEYEPS